MPIRGSSYLLCDRLELITVEFLNFFCLDYVGFVMGLVLSSKNHKLKLCRALRTRQKDAPTTCLPPAGTEMRD